MLLLVTHSSAAFLLATGIVAESFFALGIATLVLSTFWLSTLYSCFINPAVCFRFTTLVGSFISISYYLGAMPQLIFSVGAHNLHLHQFRADVLAMTIIYIQVFSLVLFGISRFEASRTWQSIFSNLSNATSRTEAAILIYAIVVALFQTHSISSGAWNYMGTELSERGEVSIIADLTQLLATPLTPLIGWVIGKRRRLDAIVLILIAILLLQIFWWMVGGRRLLAYALVSMFVFWVWGSRKKPHFMIIILTAIPLIFGLNIMSKYFMGLRYVAWSYDSIYDLPSASELFFEVIDVAHRKPELLDNLNRENLSGRSFVIGYASSVVERLEVEQIQFGIHIRNSLLRAIPRFIFPNKSEFINNTPFEEYHLDRIINLPIYDKPWSLVISSYADFMILGAAIYPCIILVFGILLVYIIRTFRMPFFQLLGIGMILNLSMHAETSFTNYLTTLRFLGFMVPFLIVVRLATPILRGKRPIWVVIAHRVGRA